MENKLYVGNLPFSTTKEELEEVFSEYGQVKEITIIQGKGFGFVEMTTEEEAQAAKEALNETDLGGRTMRIDIARPFKPRERGGDRRGGYGGNGRY